MSLTPYVRQGDFSDDETSNKGGRSSQDSAQLDAELDAVKATMDEAAALFDVLLRTDHKLADSIVETNSLSQAVINYLSGVINSDSTWIHTGSWAATKAYAVHNIVSFSGDSYLCVVAHTSPAVWDGVNWENLTSGALPGQSGKNLMSLVSDGTNADWKLIEIANTTGIAPSVNPTFTGAADFDGSIKTNKVEAGSGATRNIDFNGSANQTISLTADTTLTTSNRAAATGEVKIVDVIITCDASARLFTFPSNWIWLTPEPGSITANKTAVLSLRSTDVNDNSVIAAYVEEP